MRKALTTGSASWINTPEETAPFSLLRDYTERRLGRRIKSAAMLPKD
jgi:DNA repair protein RecO (recombination protein O)